MPVNQHLTWVEIKDFAPGLVTAADWLVPPQGWTVFEDAYPQVQGGIRAFHKATAMSTSGIGSLSKERVIGLHARGGIALRSGAPTDGLDRYLCTYLFDSSAGSGSKARPKFYRMDETNGESTWTEINATSGTTKWAFASNDNNAPQKTSFRYMRQLAGSPDDQWVIAVVRYVGSDEGVWRFNYNDLSSAQHGVRIQWLSGTVNPGGAIAIHQSRLLVGAGGTQSDTIYFSDPGDADSNDSTSFVEVDPSQDLPQIVAMTPSPPSDLFVLRSGAPPVLVQGELENQTSQVMGEGIAAAGGMQDMLRAPDGYAFISTHGYVYMTDGVTYTQISQQLGAFNSSADVVSSGDVNLIGDFIFAPTGHVYHVPTKSWFTQTQMAGTFHNVERSTMEIWGPVGNGPGFTLARLFPTNTVSAPRVSTYHIKSGPIEAVDGRRIGIREIQMYVKSYDASATITVTVNGVANTVTCPTTGKQMLSFLFQQRGEVLDVDIVTNAGNASNEAPSIERLRLGFEPGTNLAPSE